MTRDQDVCAAHGVLRIPRPDGQRACPCCAFDVPARTAHNVRGSPGALARRRPIEYDTYSDLLDPLQEHAEQGVGGERGQKPAVFITTNTSGGSRRPDVRSRMVNVVAYRYGSRHLYIDNEKDAAGVLTNLSEHY